jgi:hypothetical protein
MGQLHNFPFDEVMQIQVDYFKIFKRTSKHIWIIITRKDMGNSMSEELSFIIKKTFNYFFHHIYER